MKSKIIKSVLLVLSLVCILLCKVQPTYAMQQGTNGDELQVAEPEQLVIQLGESWAGVEFELKTDAGMYPGTIPVGEDGVLRLEIGGSKNYILSCLNSSVPAPDPELQVTEPDPNDATHQTDPETDPTASPSTQDSSEAQESDTPNDDADAGIPTTHIVIFGVGLVVAIGILIGLKYLPKKHTGSSEYEDDDDE